MTQKEALVTQFHQTGDESTGPSSADVEQVVPLAAVKPQKAQAAGGGAIAGYIAGRVVSRIAGLDGEEADILTGLLTGALAYVAAYLRRVGPVLLRRVGLPE